MAIRLGLDGKLYYGVAGATASNEIANVKDVTLNLEKAESDVTTRGSGGWRQTVGTLKDGTIEFQMVWDPADAAFTAVKNAFINNTALAFLCLDEENGQGLDADFTVTNFSRSEPLEEAQMVAVTIKPTYSSRAPQWVD